MKEEKSVYLDNKSKLEQAYALLLTDPSEGRKLASEVENLTSNSNQVDANERAKFIILSSYYVCGDAENLQKYVEQYWRDFKDYNNEVFKAELYKFQSIYLFITRRAQEAKDYIRKAIDIYDKNNENVNVVHCYLLQATIYYTNYEIAKAFETYDLFIDTSEDFPEIDSTYILNAMANMSSLFMQAGDFEEAISLIDEADELYKKSGKENLNLLFSTYLNKAECNLELNNLGEVSSLLKSAGKVLKKLDSTAFVSELNGLWANYYFKNGDFNMAEKYALLATKGKIQTRGSEFIDSDNFIILYCQILGKQGRFNEVKDLAESYIEQIEELNIDFKKENSYEKMAELYKSEGLYEEACIYFAKWKEVHLKLQPIKEALRESKIERREKLKARREEFIHKETLAQKNEELGNFIRMASHDMKSPLKNIKQFGELISKSNIDNEQKEYLGFIKDSSEKMDRLLMDLLEYTKVGLEEGNWSIIDISSIMSYSISELKEHIGKSQVEIKLNNMLSFKSDLDSIQTLLSNMLSHCISRAIPDKDSLIQVSCRDLDDFIQIIFEDNGMEIDRTQLENIFDPFTRLKLSTGHSENNLKLATCKRIVERLGGQIAAESEKGLGCRFYISIPKI